MMTERRQKYEMLVKVTLDDALGQALAEVAEGFENISAVRAKLQEPAEEEQTMGYKVLEALSLGALREDVDVLRAAGYDLVGGVAVTREESGEGGRTIMNRRYYQAMVREDEAVISGLGKMVELEAMPLVDVEKVRGLQTQLREAERLGQEVYEALKAVHQCVGIHSVANITRARVICALQVWEQYHEGA